MDDTGNNGLGSAGSLGRCTVINMSSTDWFPPEKKTAVFLCIICIHVVFYFHGVSCAGSRPLARHLLLFRCFGRDVPFSVSPPMGDGEQTKMRRLSRRYGSRGFSCKGEKDCSLVHTRVQTQDGKIQKRKEAAEFEKGLCTCARSLCDLMNHKCTHSHSAQYRYMRYRHLPIYSHSFSGIFRGMETFSDNEKLSYQ